MEHPNDSLRFELLVIFEEDTKQIVSCKMVIDSKELPPTYRGLVLN